MSVQEQLQQVLQGTLESRKEVRQAAEAALEQLSSEPQFGWELVTCALTCTSSPIAQMTASVFLQRYLSRHWSEAADRFKPPLVPPELRPRIRQALFEGLGHSSHGIRSQCAYGIAVIGKYDWPDFWPTLMDDLVGLLRQGSADQLEAALQVVTDLVKEDLSQDQLPAVASNLLPTLLDVLRNDQLSWDIRAKTISNFEEIISMFTTVREENPQAVKQAMEHFGPVWLGEMDRIVSGDLQADLKRDPGLLGLRNAAFKVFSTLDRDFAKFLLPYRAHLVQTACQNLVALEAPYQHYCISDNQGTLPDGYDETLVFGDLVVDLFEYLNHAARHSSVKSLFVTADGDQEVGTELLHNLLGSLVTLSQVTQVSLEDYGEDANIFLAEDDDELSQGDLRPTGWDLVGSLIDRYPRPTAMALQTTLVSTVQRVMAARAAGGEDWWKPLEAILALLGAVNEDIQGLLDEDASLGNAPTIALQVLWSEVVSPILGENDSEDDVVIQARALLFVADFAQLLPQEAVNAAFAHALVLLEDNGVENQLGRMAAIKSIKNFCRHVKPELIQSQARNLLRLLLPTIGDLKDEMLYLVLETLRAILAIEKNALDTDSVRALADIVYATWLTNSSDPVATAVTEELFEVIVSTSARPVVHALVVSLSPRLAATIASPATPDNEHLAAEAVQLSNSLIRTRGGPLEMELIATVTAAIMDCLQRTDDMSVVQYGVMHLTQVVRKDCEKLLQWRSPGGVSGMDTILQLLSRLLSPTFSETGGISVGDLIIHLLRQASSAIGPILPDLLRALVLRLAQARLPSFIQALVLPFAYLFGTEHTQATLDLLMSLPSPASEVAPSALQLVLQKWCEMSDEISGSWNIRVNALGLARLYALPNPTLREVAVRGDLIINDANRDVIITRSKAKANPAQYTAAPFPSKCLKLLLKELQTFRSTAAAKGKKVSTGTLDIDEDDGDDEWDDDDDLAGPEGKGEFDFLSSWLDEGGGDMDAQDDDEDLRSDPIAQIDMVDHLTNVLRHCYTTNENAMHDDVSGLNEAEKGILRSALTM